MDMRYKKKKRQIVSAALAVVMAMQLCVPSATFAAVPAKKLKVITGFTELPEEVAHIQIPADAGENFDIRRTRNRLYMNISVEPVFCTKEL